MSDRGSTDPAPRSVEAPAASPRTERHRRPWIGLLLALAVLVPFAFAAMARPVAPPRAVAQPIPDLPLGAPATDLSAQIEHVPLLATRLPDPATQAASDAYREVDILSPEGARSAFLDAWAAMALHTPDDMHPQVLDLAAAMLAIDAYSDLPEGAQVVFDALATDPDNGVRLTNAAVMLFGYGALVDSGIAPRPEGADYGYGWVLEAQAVQLLDEVARRFGTTREVALNLAHFVSLTGDDRGFDFAVDLVSQAVTADPGDVTARMALASLQARHPDESRGYDDAAATLAPLLVDPATRLLGEAATGDAYLAAASLRATEAPRTSAVLARRALDNYDRVLHEAGDPGVYAGRARALALLGEPGAAVEAMREAVRLAPDAVDLSLALAALQQAAGDSEAMYDTAVAALDHTGAAWAPSLAGARLVATGAAAHPGDLGLFGASVGSTRDHIAVIRFLEGGGYLADVDVVPAFIDPALDANRRSGFAPDVAARMAMDAAVARGVPTDAAAVFDTWTDQGTTTSQETFDTAYRELSVRVPAAELVAGGDLIRAPDEFGVSEALMAAEAVLRRSGDFPRLEEMCRRFLEGDVAAEDPFTAEALWMCVGDSLILQDRPEEATAAFAEAAAALEPSMLLGADMLLHWGAARLAVEPGDEEGRRLLQQAAMRGTGPEAALVRLGIDDLDLGQPASAVAHYDLVLALLDPAAAASQEEAAAERQTRVVALTNRGVALLRLAQDDPTRPPVCDPDAAGDPCAAAAAGFAEALAIDPLNAVTLMNLAWADRAMGRTAAAGEALAAAFAADPALYPAANDLGVVAASGGDTDAARDAFTATLAANPEYALGWWNLGVLELHRGPAHLAAGHAALAEAVRLDPSLAGAVPEFRTDEMVYRVTFDSVEEVSGGWAVARTYAVAATLLGGIGLLSALGRLASSALTDLWGEILALGGMNPEKRPSWASRLAGRFTAVGARVRRRIPAPLRRFVPWAFTAVALTAISAWTVWSLDAAGAPAAIAAVGIATVAALAAHESGHLLATRRWGGRLVPDQWSGGVALAVLLVPVHASSGPYLAERVEGADEDRLAHIHAAGPVANLVLAAAAYLAYLIHPVPLLLLTTQVSMAVCGYSLLPNLPLDGRPLKERPVAAALLGLVVAAVGAAFAFDLA